jgi:gamma-glutamylcyclotransferase (GGCT)/AIG2-like uncharacterized protein YtfP
VREDSCVIFTTLGGGVGLLDSTLIQDPQTWKYTFQPGSSRWDGREHIIVRREYVPLDMRMGNGNNKSMENEVSDNLFVYGTLRSPLVLTSVLSRKFLVEYEKATLDHHVLLKPGTYMIFESDNDKVQGLLVKDLLPGDFARLDAYEGVPDFYRRKKVFVTVEGGRMIGAYVYYNGPDFKLKDFKDANEDNGYTGS